MKKRTTIKDIAAAVGVSHTTVSYVMSGNTTQKISEETREAVLDAARKLNYVPNGAARSLRQNSTNCISVAMEKAVTHNRFGGLLQGIRDELRAEGYWLMLFDFNCSSALYPDYLDSVLQRSTDGIIYVSSDGNAPNAEWCKIIERNDLPFVACDCCPEDEYFSSVSFDYERGAFEVACRLLSEGARHILYWRPTTQAPQEHYREMGLRRAVELYPGSELIISVLPYGTGANEPMEEKYTSIARICRQNLAQEILPRMSAFGPNDAIICSWGVMVKQLCMVLQGNAKQIKIATLADTEVPIVTDMKILVSRPGFLEGGRESARMLLRQIRGEKPGERQVIVPDTPAYLEI